MRPGYCENPAGHDGWRKAPLPLPATTADPLLDPNAPSVDWAMNAVRTFLDGATSVDQLYRSAFDLIAYRANCRETMSADALDRDLVASFVDALWTMCLSAVLHDDHVPLLHYLPQWLDALERGSDAWQEATDSGTGSTFIELE